MLYRAGEDTSGNTIAVTKRFLALLPRRRPETAILTPKHPILLVCGEADVDANSLSRSSTFLSDNGKRTYFITVSRVTSGEALVVEWGGGQLR